MKRGATSAISAAVYVEIDPRLKKWSIKVFRRLETFEAKFIANKKLERSRSLKWQEGGNLNRVEVNQHYATHILIAYSRNESCGQILVTLRCVLLDKRCMIWSFHPQIVMKDFCSSIWPFVTWLRHGWWRRRVRPAFHVCHRVVYLKPLGVPETPKPQALRQPTLEASPWILIRKACIWTDLLLGYWWTLTLVICWGPILGIHVNFNLVIWVMALYNDSETRHRSIFLFKTDVSFIPLFALGLYIGHHQNF